jgi:SRSO17 transposase
MRLPIICLDDRLAKYLEQFRHCFSKPQYKYFVIILLGLLMSQSGFTLSGILRQVSAEVTLSGTSRFLSGAPWSTSDLCRQWQTTFVNEMRREVEAEHERQRAKQPKRPGRRRRTVVTGYLIGDDSVMQKRRGKKMGGLGQHFSSTAEKTVTGHCMVQALYTLLGRQCALEPRMYRQKAVCEAEGVPFASKLDIMIEMIREFIPVPDTATHVLLDSWYAAKKVWQAARERGFSITCGIRSNRSLRIDDPNSDKGWRWQKLSDYAAQLKADAFTQLSWPGSERQVYIHVISTRIRRLYRCQLICIRETLDGQTKFWVSSDLEADMETLLGHIGQRWDIEVLFADVKELLGLDQYQVINADAIHRFWVLVMMAYGFLEHERSRLQQEQGRHVTIGDACRHVQRAHWSRFLDWLHHRYVSEKAMPSELHSLLLV